LIEDLLERLSERQERHRRSHKASTISIGVHDLLQEVWNMLDVLIRAADGHPWIPGTT